ncbi:DUF4783 domain-containing protein [Halocola ammonii]
MRFLITFSLLMLSFGVFSQNDITNEISNAFAKGDAAAIVDHFQADVDMTVLDEEDVYSPEEAREVLEKFFAEHNPTGFKVKHEGTSKLNDQYRIGDLTTDNGSFRVTFFLKGKSNVMKIEQLRIE